MNGWRRTTLAVLAAAALVVGACGGGGGTKSQPAKGATSNGTNGKAVKTDVGVTKEPCPGSAHPTRGCIYLGTLSDLTTGPFAALAVPITAAQKAFWDHQNAGEGIGGAYDVDTATYTRDNKYNPETHVARYQEIQPKVLALAQSLGTPMTIAALPLYKKDNMLAVPASWWSGWKFVDNVLESGSSYCMEAMNGLDYATDEFKPKTAMAVHFAGDYGGDYANGFVIAAKARNIKVLANVETQPKAVVGSQEAAIDAIVRNKPDVVFLATAPGDMADIVGGAASRGFTGHFVGAGPTWNPGLLATPAAPAIEKQYMATFEWAPFGADTPGHKAMRAAVGEVKNPNDGYTFGWGWQYPLKAALQGAYAAGDLTRAGVLKAVTELKSVDYEGMLPAEAGVFSGKPSETVFRQTLIVKPDKAAPTGVSVAKDFFAGPTAKGYALNGPCQEIAGR
jgi:ABC-type branched-subunit amino acid transport system substrate-binding protein